MRALLVVLVVLLGLAAVADRVAVGIAEDRVAEAIATEGELAGPPDVSIEGWPFLTQAMGGTYEDVRISLSAADLGQPEGTTADVRLQGVRVPLSDVLDGSVTEIPVDRIDGTVTLSYELLSRELGTDTTLAPEGGGLRLTKTVRVLGFEVPLTAVGTVVLQGQELVIDVDEAGAAGVDLPGSVVAAAADALDLRYAVDLPFGLELTSVSPGDDGVRVTGGAVDTVLRGG
ncbi:LmeA family phospholipid-binding protein [Trujillonella humicola]|uniref:LmeA family phospholipid-binding protein n=1 Tax=Trujillonella humicola TaxID=3383699 RepID=UPI0039060420